jgi:hypothetical protein
MKSNPKIYAGHKIVYGGAIPAIPTNEILQGLSKSTSLYTSPYGLYFKVACGLTGDKVPFVAVPSSWGINVDQIRIGGAQFTTDSIQKYPTSYTNASGGNLSYDVFCLDQEFIITGDVIVEIINLKV